VVVTLPTNRPAGARARSGCSLVPDGSRLVLSRAAEVALAALTSVRSIRFDATLVPGTDGAESPFFSPDGQSLDFLPKAS